MKSSLNMLDLICLKHIAKILHELITVISFYIFKHLKISLTLPQSKHMQKELQCWSINT